MTPYEAFQLLTPEIALGSIAFLVLMFDLLFLRKDSVEHRHRVVGVTVFAGLAVVACLYFLQLADAEPRSLGNGAYVVSRLNTFFKFVVIGLTFLTVLIGLETPYSSHVGEYYSLLLFSTLGMVFLISSEDLLMIFISLELISLALYALTGFQKGARRSAEGGLKYFIFGGLSAAFLLFGLSYIFGATGHTGLKDIAVALSANHQAPFPGLVLQIGILFSLVGLGFKIAAAPFHLWAPDAYEGAPTPVAALIATGSKVASFVALTKFLLGSLLSVSGTVVAGPSSAHAGWAVTVAAIAVLSMVVGNLAAIAQTNVKRLLAYSSVAHAGYILVAMVAISAGGVPSRLSIPAIYFYVLIYALTNIGAFGVVNTIASQTGGDSFEHFTGAAQRAPFLSLLMLIFMLSLAGIPPLAGFFGKFYLFASAVQADPQNLGLLWLVSLAIAMSAVSLYYYLKLTKQMYVLVPLNPTRLHCCPTLTATLGVIGLAVVLFGVFPNRLVDIFGKLSDQSVTISAPAKPIHTALNR